jgi:Fe-S-cluster containining protein
MDPTVLKELDTAFFNDGYHIAKEELNSNLTLNGLVRMTEKVYIYINEFNRAFENRCSQEGQAIDCKKSCSYCCQQSVFILPHEAIYLAYYIEKVFPKEKQERIVLNASRKDSSTSGMNVQKMLHYKESCPLLENDSCSAYNARPMACRIYYSSDVTTCIREFEHPTDLSKYPALYDIPLRAGRMLNEGICAYLLSIKIKPVEWMLESHLGKAMKDKLIIDNWLAGQDVFKVRDLEGSESNYLNQFSVGKKNH